MLAQSQPFDKSGGLLWGRTSSDETYTVDDEHLHSLEKAGVERSFLEKLQPIKGKIYQASERTAAVSKILGTDWQKIVSSQKLGDKNTTLFKKRMGEVGGYYASGYLGQFLVIVPKQNRRRAPSETKQSLRLKNHGFEDFISLVMQLGK